MQGLCQIVYNLKGEKRVVVLRAVIPHAAPPLFFKRDPLEPSDPVLPQG
jgi:hypothetical protein